MVRGGSPGADVEGGRTPSRESPALPFGPRFWSSEGAYIEQKGYILWYVVTPAPRQEIAIHKGVTTRCTRSVTISDVPAESPCGPVPQCDGGLTTRK